MSAAEAGSRGAAVAAAVMAAASVAALAVLEARPRDFSEVAAIFPPWMARERALAAVISAGGLVVRQGAVGSILVVHGNDPGVIGRLHAAGAWLVIDPVAFGGCLLPPRNAP